MVALLSTVRAASLLALRSDALRGPVLSTASAVIEYLNAAVGYDAVESTRILFLDAKNHLLREEILGTGTVDKTFLPVREILRRALELNATGFLVVHNHPSGDPTASEADRVATAQLAAASRQMEVRLLDHLIVARGKWASFVVEGWL